MCLLVDKQEVPCRIGTSTLPWRVLSYLNIQSSSMNARYAQLLYELVDEYIQTAEPVGSFTLQRLSRLDVSSATIRGMLRGLEDEGYLLQPHTSAGRIPTDKGYRHYVDHLRIRQLQVQQQQRLLALYETLREEYGGHARPIAKALSRAARTVAVSAWMSSDDIQEAGLPTMFWEREENYLAAMRDATSFLDDIEHHMTEFVQPDRSSANIYIGSENPVPHTQHISVVARTAYTTDGESVVLLLIGPKRMPYQRNVALLNGMANVIEQVAE